MDGSKLMSDSTGLLGENVLGVSKAWKDRIDSWFLRTTDLTPDRKKGQL